ncbi:pentatricopeptide repeat-containing protein At3g62890-like [Alnus glutinosa]|uniref:pentatricopeptide repeat-containing protein At3g62890-like n=1 Tax=Alnus glutinosa TaxID=3517 RepID=UPI002D7A025D|nr:pentatricopeptide repeat-containing protein At3g62890-like [Alnus glutinosa]
MLERDEVSWNSMILGYVYWGEVEKARELFEEMPLRGNVVCWTAMINGYGKEGNLVEMLDLFCDMLVSADEAEPNSATMVCLVSACSSLANFEVVRWISTFIDVNAIPLNIFLSTALIDMYSKCGDVEKARRIFDRMSSKNLASWNAIITGYVQNGLMEEAIQLFIA